MSLATLKNSVHDFRIHTDDYTGAESRIKAVHETYHDTTPSMGLLVGQSRTGKTRVCRSYIDKYPSYDAHDRTVKPVVMVELEASEAVGGVLNCIYEAITGHKFRGKILNSDKSKKVCQALKNAQTELLIIDEAQHAITQTVNHGGKLGEFANTIKRLLDGSGVPILLTGQVVLTNIYTMKGIHHETSEQLEFRSVKPYRMHILSREDVKGVFLAFLKKFIELNIDVSEIRNSLTADQLYIASSGRIGMLSKLLQKAIIESNGIYKISNRSLQDAGELLLDEGKDAFHWNRAQVDLVLPDLIKTKEVA